MILKKHISIAIDGPAGAGKSSVAKIIAKKLGFVYLDTGALYRAVALHALNSKNPQYAIDTLDNLDLKISIVDDQQNIFLNNENITKKIRTPKVSSMASKLSAKPEVREFLLDMQRDFAKKYDVLMDGRDIGTTILPNATVKIFLTASPTVRAKRRYKQLCEKGQNVAFENILSEINERDYRDEHRDISPLQKADDAILVDNSDMNFDQTVHTMIALIQERIDSK